MGTVQYNIKLLAQNYKTIFSNKKEACDKNSSLWACVVIILWLKCVHMTVMAF